VPACLSHRTTEEALEGDERASSGSEAASDAASWGLDFSSAADAAPGSERPRGRDGVDDEESMEDAALGVELVGVCAAALGAAADAEARAAAAASARQCSNRGQTDRQA
jgi:hypothetical protein